LKFALTRCDRRVERGISIGGNVTREIRKAREYRCVLRIERRRALPLSRAQTPPFPKGTVGARVRTRDGELYLPLTQRRSHVRQEERVALAEVACITFAFTFPVSFSLPFGIEFTIFVLHERGSVNINESIRRNWIAEFKGARGIEINFRVDEFIDS